MNERRRWLACTYKARQQRHYTASCSCNSSSSGRSIAGVWGGATADKREAEVVISGADSKASRPGCYELHWMSMRGGCGRRWPVADVRIYVISPTTPVGLPTPVYHRSRCPATSVWRQEVAAETYRQLLLQGIKSSLKQPRFADVAITERLNHTKFWERERVRERERERQTDTERDIHTERDFVHGLSMRVGHQMIFTLKFKTTGSFLNGIYFSS